MNSFIDKQFKDITFTDEETIKKYEKNITEFTDKKIKSVIIPNSLSELQNTIKNANEEKVNIHVISTGKNWGLGSKQPITDNNSIIHLKKLNTIIEVNEQYRYAIIEPGVTQNQLSEYLLKNHPNFKFPVTGSAKGTSVVGNLIERGVAAFGHKNHKVVAMEVLLSDGELLRTGFWHYFKKNNPLAFHYPYGHGPDLRGLFTQSNLGIITKVVIRLTPRLEGVILTLKFKESSLKSITNLLRKQFEDKILDEGIVITNLNDPRTTNNKKYQYNGEWIACANFSGPKELLKCKKKLLQKQYPSSLTDTFFISSSSNPFGLHKSSLYPFIIEKIQNNSLLNNILGDFRLKSGTTFNEIYQGFSTLKNFYQGIPSNHSIETMAMINNTVLKDEELDNTNILGLSLVLPAVPFDGNVALEISDLVNQVSKKWNVMPFHNLATVDELTFEGFYRIYFDREDNDAVKIAHSWSKEIHELLRDKGYYPYRIDNKLMQNFIDKSDVYWKIIKKLKQTLDQNEIISKKRYSI